MVEPPGTGPAQMWSPSGALGPHTKQPGNAWLAAVGPDRLLGDVPRHRVAGRRRAVVRAADRQPTLVLPQRCLVVADLEAQRVSSGIAASSRTVADGPNGVPSSPATYPPFAVSGGPR